MEMWFLILVSVSISLLLHAVLGLLRRNSAASQRLPPVPFSLPFAGTLWWVLNGMGGLEFLLRNAHRRLGPMVTLYTTRPEIFVSDHSLAHQALIQNGAVFADRPPALPTISVNSSNQHIISFASYGPTWRLLRRNLTSEILHPSRLRSYSHARKWVLQILVDRFRTCGGDEPVVVVDHVHYAMFALLVLICFGDKLDEKQIQQVELVQRQLLLRSDSFNILNVCPKLTKLLLRKKWEEFFQLRRDQESVFIPLISARRRVLDEKAKHGVSDSDDKHYVVSYVDTLLDLELPDNDEKRKLNESEMVSLCSEFLGAGTDTTSTALEWIMANLVKYQEIQNRLYEEIRGIVGETQGESEISEADLQKMPYLKAVVLEGLRRHPPAHLLLPHSVTNDNVLGGYSVPKNSTINFMVAEMGWDPKVWKDPKTFKPERFIESEEAVDITGSRGIKMMPFGAGRRICPGLGLALLHLEYFVANLVAEFEWKAAEGDDVDLSEKHEFTVVMNKSLKAHALPRRRTRELVGY